MDEVERILNKILDKIAAEYNFINYDLKVVPIIRAGDNHTSTLYNVTIKEGGNIYNLFAKMAAKGDKIRVQAPKVYYTEIFMYTELGNVFERLQDFHQVPQGHRLKLPKFYGCNPTIYEETIVLENLVMKGYQAYDKCIAMDWRYASSAMSEIAKMHAISFAYSEYYSESFKKVFNYLKFDCNTQNKSHADYIKAMETAIGTVQENIRDSLKQFLGFFGPEKYSQLFSPVRKPVLVHGDFRPGNLMHKIRDSVTVDIKVVDFQTVVAASPIVDLLYFIFTGTDQQFRQLYFEKLLDHYYKELHAAMKRFHLNPEKVYSKVDFELEFKDKLPFGLSIAVLTLPIVTRAFEDTTQVKDDIDEFISSSKTTSYLYLELLNGVVNDYIKWGLLK